MCNPRFSSKLLLLAIFIGWYQGYAQLKLQKFEYLTSKQGLSDNYVQHILEDSYGFVWVSTNDGLNRYDGYSFTQFKHSNTNIHSLASNLILLCFEDTHRQIWVGMLNGGLARYNRSTNQFDPIALRWPKETKQITVRAIQQYNDSLYIVGTYNGLCLYNAKNGAQKWYFHQEKSKDGLAGNDIATITIDEKHRVWIGLEATGTFVHEFDVAHDKITRYQAPEKLVKSDFWNSIRSIVALNDSTLSIGSQLASSFTFNTHTYLFSELNLNFGTHGIYCLTKINDSVFLIGSSYNNGLWQYNIHSNKTKQILDNANTNFSLNSSSISCIIKDKQNNIWIGTHGGGVNVVFSRKSLFEHYQHSNDPHSLSGNLVSSFYELPNGNMLVGTDGGGFNYFDKKNEQFWSITTKNGLLSNAVVDVQAVSNNEAYIATWDGGLDYINLQTKQIKHTNQYIRNIKDIQNFNLKGITLIDDTLYIATHFDGLYLVSLRENRIINRISNTNPKKRHYFPTVYANKVRKDSKGNLWISSTRGLLKIEKDTTIFYETNITDSTSISNNYVTDVFEDSKQQLWVCTSVGPNLYDYKTKRFVRINEKYGLNYAIKSIVEDRNGFVWMGTNEGLLQVNTSSFETRLFTEADGLQDNQFFERAAYCDSLGKIWIGGINGFNVFDPQKLKDETFNPPIYLTNFRIFNQDQTIGKANSPLKQNIQIAKNIDLRYNQNFISFEYAAIEFSASSQIRYKYKLEGLDKDWVVAGYSRMASYTNIPPGDYTFSVMASNAQGQWGKQSAHIQIHISPPWWLTWWFKIIVVLCITGILFAIYYFRTQQVRLQNKRLEREVFLQTEELLQKNAELNERYDEILFQRDQLESYNREITQQSNHILKQQGLILHQNSELETLNKTKDRLFSIIAHDLKNPLNGILGFSSLLMDNIDEYKPEKITKFVSCIYQSANSINDLLSNLLTWARSQTGSVTFNPQKIKLHEIAISNTELYTSLCKEKEILLEISIDQQITVFADYYMLDTIVRNLINNAVKFTPSGGIISLSARTENDKILFSIKDTGIGMTPEQQKSLFNTNSNVTTQGTNNEKGTGLGFKICLEFLASNKAKIELISEPNKGSEFIIELHNSESSFNNALSNSEINSNQNNEQTLAANSEDSVIDIIKRLSGKRILVVDDNVMLRTELFEYLSSTVQFFEAQNGEEGWIKTLEIQPDIIISDVVMPVMNGIELCTKLKTDIRTCHIPTILLTAEMGVKNQITGLQSGAISYINKPFNRSVLFSVIDNILRVQDQQRAKFNKPDQQQQWLNGLCEPDKDLLKRATQFISENLHKGNISVEMLTDELQLSRTVLYTKIKSITGLGVHEFILSIKLKHSLQLLQRGNLNVSQVAYECGFSSISHFSKAFSQQYGKPPTVYLAQK